MDPRFAQVVESLHPAYTRLVDSDPRKASDFPLKKPLAGVYLFTEAGQHLYVGRTRHVRKRLDAHRRSSSRMNQAALAVLMAKRALGLPPTTYASGEGSNEWLSTHPPFVNAFAAAKERIREMEFRFVEEADPIRQTVLEVYCAVVLETPYNKFATT